MARHRCFWELQWGLMRSKSTASFAVIRYNLRTYEPGGVMAILKGRRKAEAMLAQFESEKSREDRVAGWGYFLEETDLPPGMDPQKATSLRQTRMDVIESKAGTQ
jgi:hypothetical protein